MDYSNKYYKYKNKYITYKNKYGGSISQTANIDSYEYDIYLYCNEKLKNLLRTKPKVMECIKNMYNTIITHFLLN